MKTKIIIYMTALFTFCATSHVAAAPPKKGEAAENSKSAKSDDKPKRDTYPLYGKVSAITSRTLTIVRSDSPEAKESKYTLNADTEFSNGEKAATADDVKVGKWVGGMLKKSEGDGNDIVVKLNVGVKQKEPSAKGAEAKGPKKGESKSSTKK